MNVVRFQVVRVLDTAAGDLNRKKNFLMLTAKFPPYPDQLLTQMFGQNRYLVQTEENEQQTVVVLESLMKQTRLPNQEYLKSQTIVF